MSEEDAQTNPAQETEDTTFDLIVIGTGLVESMVSCAAAKARKRVLHLDESDTYGGIYMSHSYTSLGKLFRASPASPASLAFPAQQQLEDGAFSLLPQSSLYHTVVDEDHLPSSLASQDAKLRAHPSCWHPSMVQLLKGKGVQAASESAGETKSSDPSPSHLHPAFLLAEKDPVACIAIQALAHDRDFNFSLLPKVLLSTGKFINALLHSGVHRYLEFKTIDSVYFHLTQQAAGSSLWKIPCSKNDIFNTKQLSALEKRALMKFHQMVADWGRAAEGTDVKALNEIELAVGRSLYRPQNKQELHSNVYKADEDDDKPFSQLMASFLLSPKLQSLIQYGLCFHPGPTSSVYRAGEALRDLSLHINSLGRYSETALLACMYGVSEMVQGFCRMSAVWGSTFVLRRRVVCLRPQGGKEKRHWQVVDDQGGVFEAPAVVVSGLLPTLSCQPVMRLVMTALCVGQGVQTARSIAVLPPGFVYKDAQSAEMIAVGNDYAVHILQTDESTAACPAGMSVVTMHTLLADPAAQQDRRLETWTGRAKEVEGVARELVQKIRGAVLENTSAGPPPVVVKFVAVLMPLTELSLRFFPGEEGGEGEREEGGGGERRGRVSLAVCGSAAGTSLHMESEVAQAEAIVRSVLGLDKLFEEPDEDDRQGEYGESRLEEDDEMHMLSQAFALASSSSASAAQGAAAEAVACEEKGVEQEEN